MEYQYGKRSARFSVRAGTLRKNRPEIIRQFSQNNAGSIQNRCKKYDENPEDLIKFWVFGFNGKKHNDYLLLSDFFIGPMSITLLTDPERITYRQRYAAVFTGADIILLIFGKKLHNCIFCLFPFPV